MARETNTHPKMVCDHTLAIGIPIIDEQHAVLCALANRLLNHPEALACDEHVVDILTDLGKFLFLHIRTEETIMKELGMPGDEIEKHKQAHSVIIDQYANLNLATVSGKHHTATEVFGLVKQWIGDHLVTEDLKIKNYVSAIACEGR